MIRVLDCCKSDQIKSNFEVHSDTFGNVLKIFPFLFLFEIFGLFFGSILLLFDVKIFEYFRCILVFVLLKSSNISQR